MADGLGVDGLVVRYPAAGGGVTTAVDDVSLQARPGAVVALLGPSGCGKSSLLRAVAGLEPPVAGDVTWDGVSVLDVPVHRRGFGLLFQDGQLFAHRDVAGNVAYGIAGRPGTRARVDELLALVGLPGYGRRDPATLSGGERQRVALARALAPRPRLLLLDEPLSALDRALRERLAADLRSVLLATGTTALFVTHDQDEAFAVADEVAVMSAGRLLQVDAPARLWRRPADAVVATFLGYEAFVPADAPAAAPWRAASGRFDDAGGRAAAAGTLALYPGALLVSPGAGDPAGTGPEATVDPDTGASGAGGPALVHGVVVEVRARRGHTEVVVDVPDIGLLTAHAPVGWTASPGAVIRMRPDPEAVATLP